MLKEQPSAPSFSEASLRSIFEKNLPINRIFDELCGYITLHIRRKNEGRIPDNFYEIFPDEAIQMIDKAPSLSENAVVKQMRYLIDTKREADLQNGYSHRYQLGNLQLEYPHRSNEYMFDKGVYIFVDYKKNKLQTMQRLLIGADGVDIYSDIVMPGYMEYKGNRLVLDESIRKSYLSRIHRFLVYMQKYPKRKVHGWVPVMHYL